jgi:hypothetical protein
MPYLLQDLQPHSPDFSIFVMVPAAQPDRRAVSPEAEEDAHPRSKAGKLKMQGRKIIPRRAAAAVAAAPLEQPPSMATVVDHGILAELRQTRQER